MGRPLQPFELSAEERVTLERWARRPSSRQALAMRAQLVLSCAGGRSNGAVARELRTSPQTVCKWRGRFLRARLDGLLDEPRPGKSVAGNPSPTARASSRPYRPKPRK
jgi:winged helix-turn helix protein